MRGLSSKANGDIAKDRPETVDKDAHTAALGLAVLLLLEGKQGTDVKRDI